MLTTKYKIRKLKNGMRVLLVPNKSVDSINVSVFFRVGSRCEEAKVSGISHFLEHMFFKGTVNRPTTADISEAIDSVGGEMNAFTSYEYTGYYIKVAKNHIELAMDVLSDMILNSKFDKDELKRERNVIKEEIKLYQDNPTMHIWRLWNNVLYGTQGLGRDIAGTFGSVDRVNSVNMRKYRDDFYSIANGLMVIVGNFNDDKLMNLANNYWSKILTGKKSRFVKADDKQKGPKLLLEKKDTQQANICIGVRTHESFHPDHFICNLISVILGQGMSSRLFLRVREREGLAYSVNCSMDNYTDVGNMVVYAGTDLNKADRAIGLILEEFERIRTEELNEKELRKAKEYWKGKMILSLEDVDSLANMIGMQELMFDKIMTPQQMMEKIEMVTTKDILRVAQDIFGLEKTNLALIGPYENDDSFQKILGK